MYVIVAPEIMAMKVGISNDICKRMDTIRVSIPFPLELVGVIQDGGRAEELRFHKALAPFHIRGEWFKLSAHSADVTAALLQEYGAMTGEEYLAIAPGRKPLRKKWSPAPREKGRQDWQGAWEDCCVEAWDVIQDPESSQQEEQAARDHLHDCFMDSMPPLPWIWLRPDGTEVARMEEPPPRVMARPR